jgi:hypothetical protein
MGTSTGTGMHSALRRTPEPLRKRILKGKVPIERLRIRIHFIRIQHFRLNTDPDPIRIRIKYGSGSNPDQIRIRIQSGSRALMTKNFKKITAEKKLTSF